MFAFKDTPFHLSKIIFNTFLFTRKSKGPSVRILRGNKPPTSKTLCFRKLSIHISRKRTQNLHKTFLQLLSLPRNQRLATVIVLSLQANSLILRRILQSSTYLMFNHWIAYYKAKTTNDSQVTRAKNIFRIVILC